MSVSLYLVLILLVLIFFKLTRKSDRYNELLAKLPGTNNNCVQNLLLLVRDLFKTHDAGASFFVILRNHFKMFQKDGIYCLRMQPILNDFVVLLNPKSYRDLLIDQVNLEKNFTYHLLEDLIGHRNLIISGGPEWKHDRKVIDPSFKYSIVMSMNGLISKTVNSMITYIDQLKQLNGKTTIPDMHRLLQRIIAQLIFESAVGVEVDSKSPNLIEYVETMREFADTIVFRYAFPFLLDYHIFYYLTPSGIRMRKQLNRVSSFVSEVVSLRMKQVKEKEQNLIPCLADTLINKHLAEGKESKVTPGVIIDQVNTFVFVGHKATSITLNAILFLLACHEDEQRQLQKELDETFDVETVDEELLSNDKINKCVYLNAVVKEGQRMYPISASIGRKITKETVINGYTIPEGVHVFLDFNSLTKHPESYPVKPNEFIPERHIPGHEYFDSERDPFSLLPFSHGLRKCIGEKFATNILKVFLVKLLLKYDITTTQSMDSVKLVQDIMVYFRTPVDITFTERKFH